MSLDFTELPDINWLRQLVCAVALAETTVQVLKEKDRSPTSNSYMWMQRGGTPERPVIMFDYDPIRSQAVPNRLPEGWRGYLMTDGYEANNTTVGNQEIVHLGCMAPCATLFR